jgi:hypothetical protein
MTDVSSNKRKFAFDDTGAREHKKVHLDDPRKIGIQDLHMDVGEKYLLCRTRKAFPVTQESTPQFKWFPLWCTYPRCFSKVCRTGKLAVLLLTMFSSSTFYIFSAHV